MKRLKIMMLSHMYPRTNNPMSGNFIHEGNEALLLRGVQLIVVSPIPYVPACFQNNPRRQAYREMPAVTKHENITVYYPKYLCGPGRLFHAMSTLSLSLRLMHFKKELMSIFRPHILHSHCSTPDGYAGLILGKRLNIPTICTLRGDDVNIFPKNDMLTRILTQKVINGSCQVVAVSEGLKKSAQNLCFPDNEIKVIHNGVDCDKFKYNPTIRVLIRQRLGIDQESTVLIFIGNVEKSKGVIELAECFIYLSKKYKDLHLIMVGAGPELPNLKNLKEERGLTGRLHLPGLVHHSEVNNFLSAGDIFVLPSHNEGFPNVIKEAMACGRPIIATRVGGIPEVIENGKNGILIHPHSMESLTQAIQYCLDNPELCQSWGMKGRILVRERFSWEKNAEQYIKVYEEVLR